MNFITKHELYSSRDIKLEAKAQLKGNWKEAIFLSLIPSLFTIFFMRDLNPDVVNQNTGIEIDLVNLLFGIIQSFLATSVSFTLLDFVRNREPIDPLRGSVQAFRGKYFMNLFLLKILQTFYVFLWTLLFFIPGIVKSYSYSQAEKIFKDKVDQTGQIPSPAACLKESQKLIRGRKIDRFTLDLSFIGWYFLSILSFGIGFIWLTPYTEVSQVIFYENLLERKKITSRNKTTKGKPDHFEEVGKDPDDFSDFEDF